MVRLNRCDKCNTIIEPDDTVFQIDLRMCDRTKSSYNDLIWVNSEKELCMNCMSELYKLLTENEWIWNYRTKYKK